MKVTCESCGSKYTIKDEKVRGKRVKIRCKGCKSPIVVDGTSLDGSARVATSDSPAALSDAPEALDSMEPGAGAGAAATAPLGAFPAAGAGAAVAADPAAAVERWSVNLSETDSRDMTTEEIVSAWGSGIVTDDAYIYKPGFDDWKPILEVPELAALLSSKAPQVPDAFSPPAGQSPFAANVPRAAAAGRGGDLFGAAAAAGSEDDPGLSGPPPAMPNFDGKPTGARNESSVLFSLDALKAGFAGPSPVEASAPRKNDDPFGLGAATGLGGLGGGFDQNQALFAPPPPEPKKPKKVSLAPSAASEPAAAPLDRSKLIMIAAGVLALLVAVGGVGFALGGSGSDDKEATADSAELEKEKPTKAREDKEAAAAPDESKAEKKDTEEKKSDETEAEAKKDESKSEEKKDDESKAKADEKSDDATKSATASKTGTAKESKSDTPTRAKDTKAAAPAGDSGAPPFNKGAAISALSSAAGSAAGCKIPGGPTGSGKAIVTFAPSGRVTTANVVGGKFGGSSVGGCVASRFRRARIPAFSGSAVTVSKSFTIQ